MKKPLTIVIFSLFIFLSCKKDEIIKPKDLHGKWLLVEIYDGYVNGGSFTWHNIAIEDAHYLEFSAGGNYVMQNSAAPASQNCSGTYQILPDNHSGKH